MDYKAVNFQIQPMSEEAADVLAAMLGEAGFDTFEMTDEGLKAYIPAHDYQEQSVQQVTRSFYMPNPHIIKYSVEAIESWDWNAEWEQNSFDPVLERDFGIRLSPHGAFGSGSHETTYQLVEYLCRQDFTGQTVLDMGCGTGVLGIAMAKGGAAKVVAIDIDDLSVTNTMENFALNQLANVTAIHGDASDINGTFDTIVANIHKNIILRDLPIYVQHLRQRGMLITSGFFTEDVKSLTDATASYGLQVVETFSKNDWAVVILRLA